MKRELPPTDGLPLRGRDLLAPGADLAADLAGLLRIPTPLLTCSGTAALVIALRTLHARQPERQRVIVSAWSCPLVPLAASACPGITFVLCDLLPGTLDLDPDMLAQLCTQQPPLAIIVTHLAGRISATAAARAQASAWGAALIEDAAQGLGAEENGASVGLQGDIGFFSLAFGKGLTCGEGGVLFSRDPQLQHELARQAALALPFRAGIELKRCVQLLGYAALYNPRGLRWIYGMPLRNALDRGDDIAAVGDDFTDRDIPLHRLGRWRQRVAASAASRLPDYWQQGRQRAAERCARLGALQGITVLEDREGERGVWPVLLVIFPRATIRDTVLESLWGAGLGVTRLFVRALGDYPAVTPWLADQPPLRHARAMASRSLTITNSPWLSDSDFARIIQCIERCLAPPARPAQLP